MMTTDALQTGLRVLLAEDDRDDQMLLAEGFEGAGLSVDWHITEDGEAALDLLASHVTRQSSIDMLVLDLNMPRMDGLQVLESLRDSGSWRALPVIVLSTSTRREDADRAMALGALAVLAKPASTKEYRDLALRICELYQSATEAAP